MIPHDPLERALRRVEAEIATLEYEVAVVFAPDGTEIFRLRGDEDLVWFPPRRLARLAGTTILHNHPSGESFSARGEREREKGDVQFAAERRVGMLVVVGQEWRYTMRPPPGGWSRQVYQDLLKPVIERVDDELTRQLLEELQQSADRVPSLFYDYLHVLWTRVAAETGLQYQRERRS